MYIAPLAKNEHTAERQAIESKEKKIMSVWNSTGNTIIISYTVMISWQYNTQTHRIINIYCAIITLLVALCLLL